jgi:demethylmenaquinone methyltransferase/2-methoxy-6-polyprenyl-1,4-benzoquinol methylase/phosphoethanolamine N-methyltransferase
MHTVHRDSKKSGGPETTGATIHKAPQYDIHTSLMGLGVNHSNSRMIIEMAKIERGDKILDVGCGSGNLTLTAKSYVGQSGSVCGVDASPEMIDVARKKAERKGFDASFGLGLIEQLPYPDSTFDVVISRLVIHHLPVNLKQKGVVEIFRVLKPGGRFILVDFKLPTNRILARLVSSLVGHNMMVQSSIERLIPTLTATGFQDVDFGPTRSMFLAFVSGKKPESKLP